MDQRPIFILIVTAAFILVGALGFFLFQLQPSPRTTSQEQPIPSPTSQRSAETQTYRNEQYSIAVTYPSSWFAYGDLEDVANPDLLAIRFFVPDFSAEKSFEEQEVISLAVWRMSTSSTYSLPRDLLVKPGDHIWEPVTINGYAGTKISAEGRVKTYTFQHKDHLYAVDASTPSLFDIFLPTLTLF